MKVGIIGAGLIGGKRAESISAAKDEVYAVADVDYGRAHELAKRYGAAPYKEWRELLSLKVIDSVIIATPNKYLMEIAVEAARCKKHILCEKPLGRNGKEAKKMVVAASRYGVSLKTGFNHRHHPAISRAHDIARRGEIGEITHMRCVYGHGGRPGYEKEWRASADVCGGGELLDQGVHVIDLFRWFMGDINEVYGIVPTLYWGMEVEDNAFAVFRSSNGRVALMQTSWTQWKNKFLLEIFGNKGYLIIEGLGGSYGLEKLIVGKRKTENNLFVGGPPIEDKYEFDGVDISWLEEWKEFSASIIEKRQPLGSGHDGFMANKTIDAVYRSAKTHRPVRI